MRRTLGLFALAAAIFTSGCAAGYNGRYRQDYNHRYERDRHHRDRDHDRDYHDGYRR